MSPETQDELAAGLVARLGLDADVGAALAAVDRAAFVPVDSAADPYGPGTIPLAVDGQGRKLSTISAPSVVARLTALLRMQPGDHVLEVGTGSGYQAAVLGRLASRVDTIDVLADLVLSAQVRLAAAGARNVCAHVADGLHGLPDRGPFDRVLFSVGLTQLPEWVWEQTQPGSRVVIPLTLRGLSRAWALQRISERTFVAAADESATCGFVPLVGQAGPESAELLPGVDCLWSPDQVPNLDGLRRIAQLAPSLTATDVWWGRTEDPNALYWRLADAGFRLVRLQRHQASPAASGLAPLWPLTAALATDDALVYATQVESQGDRIRLGVACHGTPDTRLLESYLAAIDEAGAVRQEYPSLVLVRGKRPVLRWPVEAPR